MKKKCIYLFLIIINSIIPIIDAYNKIVENNTFISSLSTMETNNNVMFPICSNFFLWMCGINTSKFSHAYYYVALLTTLIACFVFSYNKNSNEMLNNNISKYSKIFLLSGFLVSFPLLFNFILISMFIPSVIPDSVYDIYYGIFSDNSFGDIFYRYPFLYFLLFIVIVFIFWGLIGGISYGLTKLFKCKLIPLLLEITIILILHYIQSRFVSEQIFSPLSIFSSYKCLYDNYKNIFIEILELLVFIGILIVCSLNSNKLVKDKI